MKKYQVSYTQKDGQKVKDQIYTAEHISELLKSLEMWGCSCVVINSLEDRKNDPTKDIIKELLAYCDILEYDLKTNDSETIKQVLNNVIVSLKDIIKMGEE